MYIFLKESKVQRPSSDRRVFYISTHRSSITTLPFGRLVCGRRACPSRTLYRLIY